MNLSFVHCCGWQDGFLSCQCQMGVQMIGSKLRLTWEPHASSLRYSNEVSLDQTECRVTFEYNVTKLPDTGVVQKTRMSQREGDKENNAISPNEFLVAWIKLKSIRDKDLLYNIFCNIIFYKRCIIFMLHNPLSSIIRSAASQISSINITFFLRRRRGGKTSNGLKHTTGIVPLHHPYSKLLLWEQRTGTYRVSTCSLQITHL